MTADTDDTISSVTVGWSDTLTCGEARWVSVREAIFTRIHRVLAEGRGEEGHMRGFITGDLLEAT